MIGIGNLIEGLKLPTKILFAIALATGLLLFAPEQFVKTLGLQDVVVKHRQYLGGAFIISFCICLVSATSWLWGLFSSQLAQRRWVRRGRSRLQNLNPEEREILAYYIENQTREQTLSIMSGTARVLEAEKIIFRAS